MAMHPTTPRPDHPQAEMEDSPPASDAFAALDAYLDSSELEITSETPTEPTPDNPVPEASDDTDGAIPSLGVGSPALGQLDRSRRPSPSTVCEVCPASIWFANEVSVRCYCRIMHLVTWSTAEPDALTHCDGIAIANQE